MRSYLDLLTRAYVVEQLHPWAENLGKRIVKSPKIFIADSGLTHSLLGIEAPRDLLRHPKARGELGRIRHRADPAAARCSA